jgi:phosphate-selective porin OprO/OprP
MAIPKRGIKMNFEKKLRATGTRNLAPDRVPLCQQGEAAEALQPQNKRKLAAAIALTALATPLGAARAEDLAAEIHELKEKVKQLEPLKARLQQLEAEVIRERRARKEAQQGRVQNAKVQPVPECQNGTCPPPAPAIPPVAAVVPGNAPVVAPVPVFVSFTNGLKVASEDGEFSFRIGGRLYVDGGINNFPAPAFAGSKVLPAVPESGFSNQVGIRQARLQVEGTAFKYWDYKFQYDFTGSPNDLIVGGIRDAYIGFKYFAPWVIFQVGNFYEPSSLERTNTSNYRDFIERSLAADILDGNRHIGFAGITGGPAPGLIGLSNWSFKSGLFSTSVEDGNPSAVGAPAAGSSSLLNPVPGGHQYWDAAARLTYAPILTEEALLHVGGSVRYQKPNDATAANDDRVLQPGSTLKTEANILGENLLGTQPLTCNASAATQLIGENCVKNVVQYGAELVASYGPFSVQAEYLGAHYNRSAGLIEALRAPGDTSVNFSGYYVYASWYLTGESRALAYRTYPGTYNFPGTFEQIPIINPVSAGGPGAWQALVRLDEINLNSGGFLFLQPVGLPSNIQGGRETNLTLGLNWYPDPGIRFMANWVDVLQLAAPWNRPNLNGIHPQLFEMRAQVNW